jgi:hypothetical protein
MGYSADRIGRSSIPIPGAKRAAGRESGDICYGEQARCEDDYG